MHALRQKRALGWAGAAAAPFFAVAVASWSACSGGSDGAPQSEDASPFGNADGPFASCPAEEPEAGAPCAAPEGTSCAFDVCDGIYAVCTGGAWAVAPAIPVGSGCPEGVPTSGSACPACFSADASCLYEQACAADGSAQRATCAGASWVLAPETCLVDSGIATDAASDGASGDADAASDASDASD